VGWVRIGKVVRPIGLRGMLGLAGTEGGLAGLRRIALRRGEGEPVELRLLEARAQGKVWAVQVEGVEDRTGAEGWVGAEVLAERDDLGDAGPGRHYWADLVDLPVLTVAGETVGRITGLYETGGVDVLVVTGPGGERLVPLAPYVTVERDRVVVDPPDGLLEPTKEEGTTRGPGRGR
jgi:16S rRNA processing protein RimM